MAATVEDRQGGTEPGPTAAERFTVTIKVKRFNPEVDQKPHWQAFTVDDVEGTDRVLDVLHKAKWYQDGTLTFRRSCAHGVCGSDAMVINGANALACIELVQDAAGPKYWPSVQNTGQDDVQAAHRMHLVVSSKRSRSSADWYRSL